MDKNKHKKSSLLRRRGPVMQTILMTLLVLGIFVMGYALVYWINGGSPSLMAIQNSDDSIFILKEDGSVVKLGAYGNLIDFDRYRILYIEENLLEGNKLKVYDVLSGDEQLVYTIRPHEEILSGNLFPNGVTYNVSTKYGTAFFIFSGGSIEVEKLPEGRLNCVGYAWSLDTYIYSCDESDYYDAYTFFVWDGVEYPLGGVNVIAIEGDVLYLHVGGLEFDNVYTLRRTEENGRYFLSDLEFLTMYNVVRYDDMRSVHFPDQRTTIVMGYVGDMSRDISLEIYKWGSDEEPVSIIVEDVGFYSSTTFYMNGDGIYFIDNITNTVRNLDGKVLYQGKTGCCLSIVPATGNYQTQHK